MEEILQIPAVQKLNEINQRKHKLNLKNLQIIKKLGEGNFGEVYQVKDTACYNKKYAMKKIREKLVVNFWKNLTNEVRVLAMSDHPNIIQLYAVLLDENQTLYLIFELADDQNLYELLKQQQKFTQKEAIDLIEDIVHALHYLHSLNPRVIHRDLKLENLLFFNGIIKIIDFGSSSEILDFRTTFIGTPTYLAPEIIKGLDYTEKIDIWCLGIIFYELLHGYPPFNTTTKGFQAMAVLSKKIVKEDIKFEKDISEDIQNVIRKLLNKNPKERPNTSEILEFSIFKRDSFRNSDNKMIRNATNWVDLSYQEKYDFFQSFKKNVFEYKGRKRKLKFQQKNFERKNTLINQQNQNLKNQILDLEKELGEKSILIQQQNLQLKQFDKIKNLIKEFHTKIYKKSTHQIQNQIINEDQTVKQLLEIIAKFEQQKIQHKRHNHFLDVSISNNRNSLLSLNNSTQRKKKQHYSGYFLDFQKGSSEKSQKRKLRQLQTSLYDLKITKTCTKNTRNSEFMRIKKQVCSKQIQI